MHSGQCLFNVSVDAHQMVVLHLGQVQKIVCGHRIAMDVKISFLEN